MKEEKQEKQKEEKEEGQEKSLPTNEQSMKEFDAKINELEEKCDEYLAGWKRAKADFVNFQKETEERMRQFAAFASADLVADILPALDSVDLALKSIRDEEKDTPLGQGYYLVQTQIFDILRRHGLEVVDPKDQRFDPASHEAVATKSCEKQDCDGGDDEMIISVLAKGYRLNGKLLRPAKVKVITHEKTKEN